MREIQAYDVIGEILKTKETCSIRDMNAYRDKHQYEHNKQEELNGTHDYVSINITRSDNYYIKSAYNEIFYWDSKREVFILQETVKCTCCDTEFLKYPNIDKFNRIKEFNEKYM